MMQKSDKAGSQGILAEYNVERVAEHWISAVEGV